MSSPPPSQQRQRQSSPTGPQQQQPQDPNAAAAAAALAAANAMKTASAAGVVRICGTSPAECGYCKGARAASPAEASTSSKAYSLLGDFMLPSTYEGYLYRGWRRSGTYLYKPNNWQSCCPALTIRLPVQQFTPTKSQRKVVKKMEHLLQPHTSSGTGSKSNGPQQQTNNSSSSSITKQSPDNHPQNNHKNNKSKRGNKRKLVHQQQDASSSSSSNAIASEADIGAVVEQLQQWSQAILQSILIELNHNNDTTATTTAVQPTFKVKPPPKKKQAKAESDSTSNAQSTITITLCTTICAAIAGQSKGAIDRDDLSERLSQQFKAAHLGKSIPSSTTSSVWKLTDVQRHAKSGQVFCTLQRNNNSAESPTNGTNNSVMSSDDASMKDANSTAGGVSARDKLQQWLEEHGDSMTPFTYSPSATAQALSSLSPPYSFAVQTVPAHESALDPEVHKLYFLYQTKVHQDADPFTCDLNNPNNNLNNSNSNMTGGGGGGSGEDGMEDDEWSTPATSDGNNLTNGKLMPPPPPSNSSADDAARNPPGFVDTAKRMLQREYKHVTAARLKQITKSYGSFYQFLVESPFTIPRENHQQYQHGSNNNSAGARATVTETPPSTVQQQQNNSNNHHQKKIRLPAGTYHQQYRVADMLIAVGVVDILPQGLSSVYLFYHPQFARDLVPLGKYAILQEIEFARALQLPYYYLGYYIESCTKMRYKAEYRPSELLCPTTYRWVDAMLAQRIIQTYSPVKHCCTLFYDDQVQLERDLQLQQRNKQQQQQLDKKKQNGNTKHDDEHNADDDDDMSMDDPTLFNQSPTQQRNAAATAATPTSNHHNNHQNNDNNSTRPAASTPTTRSILKKPNPSPFPPNPYVEQVKMDVGVGVPVTLSMLHERGRDTVRPLLEDFVKEAGPELSQKCLVKFN